MSSNQITPYGIDIENELTSILSQQLAAEIDKEIIKELFKKQNIRKDKIRNRDKLRQNVDHTSFNKK